LAVEEATESDESLNATPVKVSSADDCAGLFAAWAFALVFTGGTGPFFSQCLIKCLLESK